MAGGSRRARTCGWGLARISPGDATDRDLSWLNQNWGAALSRDGSRILFSDGTNGEQLRCRVAQDRRFADRPARRRERLWAGRPTRRGRWRRPSFPRNWCCTPWAPARRVRSRAGPIAEYQIAFWFPDGKSLLIVGNEPARRRVRTVRPSPVAIPVPLLDEGVVPAAIAPDGQTVLGVDAERQWRWYPLTGGASRPALGLTAKDSATRVVGWSADGQAFLSAHGHQRTGAGRQDRSRDRAPDLAERDGACGSSRLVRRIVLPGQHEPDNPKARRSRLTAQPEEAGSRRWNSSPCSTHRCMSVTVRDAV